MLHNNSLNKGVRIFVATAVYQGTPKKIAGPEGF